MIENPPADIKAKWGPLAHVTEAERNRILNLPFGQFKPAVAQIERALKDIAKRDKARLKESQLRAIHRKPVGA